MSYKYEPIPGMPLWFKPGIVCRVKGEGNDSWEEPVALVGFDTSNQPYGDIHGNWWSYAEPVELWKPQESEWVAAWNDGQRQYSLMRAPDSVRWDHDARISHLRISDLPATVEELLRLDGVEWR